MKLMMQSPGVERGLDMVAAAKGQVRPMDFTDDFMKGFNMVWGPVGGIVKSVTDALGPLGPLAAKFL